MARGTTTTPPVDDTPDPAQLQVAEPLVGEPVLVRAGHHDGVDAAIVTRVGDYLDGHWLVNVRTIADGPMSQDRWLTGVRYATSEEAAGELSHVACWPPVSIG